MVSLIFYFLSCNNKTGQEKVFRICGDVAELDADTVILLVPQILGYQSEEIKSAVEPEGHFCIDTKFAGLKTLVLDIGGELLQFTGKAGDSLYLTTNMDDFAEKLSVEGKGAEKLQYAIAQENNFDPSERDSLLKSLAFLSFDEFMQWNDSLAQQKMNFLEANKQQFQLNDDFVVFQKALIELEKASPVYYYFYTHYRKNNFQLREEYAGKKLESALRAFLDLPDEVRATPQYRDFIGKLSYYLFVKNIREQSNSKSEEQKKELKIVDNWFEGDHKDLAMAELFMEKIYGLDTAYFNDNQNYFNLIQNEAYRNYISVAQKELEEKLNRPLPSGTYIINLHEAGAEKINSLADILEKHEGKVVLMGFWASYSVAFKAEIPYIKIIQEHYKDKDLVFVFISSDSDPAAWEGQIRISQLPGYHFILNQPLYQDIMDKLQLRSIPRFVLFDDEGNLRHANVPRPNDLNASTKAIDALLLEHYQK